MILAIRTDSPETTLALIKDGQEVKRDQWESGRQLSNELLSHIRELVEAEWTKLEGVVVFAGPGSFTGLRIGITVANTLAYSLNIPVAAGRGDDWIDSGIEALAYAKTGVSVMPEYGAEANITKPKK
jgi:tRNA threonylcarbamoyladenosine biosynthesis protein TsaB